MAIIGLSSKRNWSQTTPIYFMRINQKKFGLWCGIWPHVRTLNNTLYLTWVDFQYSQRQGRTILRIMHICIYIYFSHFQYKFDVQRLYDVFFSRPKYFVTLITAAWQNFALEVELDLPQLLRLVQLQFSQLFCPLLQVLYLFFSFHTFLSFLKPGEQEPWTIKRKLNQWKEGGGVF